MGATITRASTAEDVAALVAGIDALGDKKAAVAKAIVEWDSNGVWLLSKTPSALEQYIQLVSDQDELGLSKKQLSNLASKTLSALATVQAEIGGAVPQVATSSSSIVAPPQGAVAGMANTPAAKADRALKDRFKEQLRLVKFTNAAVHVLIEDELRRSDEGKGSEVGTSVVTLGYNYSKYKKHTGRTAPLDEDLDISLDDIMRLKRDWSHRISQYHKVSS